MMDSTITGYDLYKRVRVHRRNGIGKHITPSTIYHWMRLGEIPTVKVNGATRIREVDADRWMRDRFGH